MWPNLVLIQVSEPNVDERDPDGGEPTCRNAFDVTDWTPDLRTQRLPGCNPIPANLSRKGFQMKSIHSHPDPLKHGTVYTNFTFEKKVNKLSFSST